MKHLLRLIRFPNLLIMLLTQWLAFYFLTLPLSEPHTGLHAQLLVSLGTLLVGAAGYIINDLADRDIDRVNKPERVIVDRFNTRYLLYLYLFLNFAGIATGFFHSAILGIFNTGCALLLFLYSARLKKTGLPGNFSVALLSAAVLLILLWSGPSYHRALLLMYAVFAFLISLFRELAKDIEDMEGDRAGGCRTFPLQYGLKKSRFLLLAYNALLLPALLFFAYQLVLHFKIVAALVLLAFCFIPAVAMGFLVYGSKERRDFRQMSLFAKILMLTGILSMIFLK